MLTSDPFFFKIFRAFNRSSVKTKSATKKLHIDDTVHFEESPLNESYDSDSDDDFQLDDDIYLPVSVEEFEEII